MKNRIVGSRSLRIAAIFRFATCSLCFIFIGLPSFAQSAETEKLLESIATIDDSTVGSDSVKASSLLSKLPAKEVTSVLDAFDGASARGKNWLRAIVSDVADNGEFPKAKILAYFDDRENDKDARYAAYMLLIDNGVDSQTLLANAETDPSLPVRFLKIKWMLEQAEKTKENEDKIETLNSVVKNGRSPKQLQSAAKSLGKLGEKVDLARSLGMILNWKIIGPFDNEGMNHFDTAYAPEQKYLSDGNPISEESEKGKSGPVQWQKVTTDSNMGLIDLNPNLDNAKDAIAYAFTTINVSADDAGPAIVRLGSGTANKVWVNGKPATQNNIYHSGGTRIDQYSGACNLVAGENTILVKALQNAQTEPWAQDWKFQLRITNPAGDAVRPIED